jgi:hypothetical protein
MASKLFSCVSSNHAQRIVTIKYSTATDYEFNVFLPTHTKSTLYGKLQPTGYSRLLYIVRSGLQYFWNAITLIWQRIFCSTFLSIHIPFLDSVEVTFSWINSLNETSFEELFFWLLAYHSVWSTIGHKTSQGAKSTIPFSLSKSVFETKSNPKHWIMSYVVARPFHAVVLSIVVLVKNLLVGCSF